MARRILFLFLFVIFLIYLYSGYYFYQKGKFYKNTVLNNPEQIIPDTTKLVLLKDSIIYFENETPETIPAISSKCAFEGLQSLNIIPDKEFSCEFVYPFSQLPTLNFIREVEVSFMAYSPKKNKEPVLWIFEINADDGKVRAWESNGVLPNKGEWQNYSFRFKIKPELLNATYKLKTYSWNKNKTTLFIDNVHISFLGFGKLKGLQ